MSQPESLPVDDRGLAYGDGCFETLRVVRGRAPLAELHLSRLQQGAERLGIDVCPQALRRELNQALAGCSTDAVIKMILTRGSGGRGYRLPSSASPRLLLQTAALPVPGENLRRQGLALHLCSLHLSSQPILAGIKHLNRLEQVLARAETDRAGLDEGLLLNARGCPVELTAMNLFARFADTLWTPALNECGVSGVMRRYLLETLLPTSGFKAAVSERPLSTLRDADEVFACNSVVGILPVRKLGLWQWPVGELTASLQQSVDELWQ